MTEYVRNTLTGNLAPVNSELTKIKTALDSKLDRKPVIGQANHMEEELDMNGYRIINYPSAVEDSDLVTKGQVPSLAPVQSVNGQTGNVTIVSDVNSVNGQTGDVVITSDVTSVNGQTGDVNIPIFEGDIGGIASFATTAEIEATTPTDTGARIENRERANAQYVLREEGYVAQAGDLTAANGRVWEYTPNEVINIDSLKGLDAVVLSEKAQYRVAGFYPGVPLGGGDFSYSAKESKDNHNGITIIDPIRASAWDGTPNDLPTLFSAGEGTGCFVRNNSAKLTLEAAGLIGDWDGVGGTDNTAALGQLLAIESVKVILGAGGGYYFGTATNNIAQHTVTRDVIIDWQGSSIVLNSDSGASGVGTAFLSFVDCKVSMHNFTFDDLDFNPASPSRGVIPLLIRSSSQSVSGHRIGPCHVERGQSVVTCISDNPLQYRARNIKLIGPCTGNQLYYGINLAASGDNFEGELNLVAVTRILFVYSVKNLNLKAVCETGRESSGFINISNDPRYQSTDNIRADVAVNELAGPLLLATTSDTPANDGVGEITAVDVKLAINSLFGGFTAGSNIVQIRSYDSSGITMPSGTATIDRLKVELDTPLELSNAVAAITSSPNYGSLSVKGVFLSYGILSDFHIVKDNSVTRSVVGDTTTNVVDVSLGYLLSPSLGPGLLRCKVDVAAQQSSGFFGQNTTIASFDVVGFVSGGNLTILTANLTSQTITGAATPSVSLTASGGNIRTAVSGFSSDASGQITVTARSLQ